MLIDPGSYSDSEKISSLGDLSAVFYTHEHQDHIDPALTTKLLAKQNNLVVYANSGAGKILAEKRIKFNLFENGTKINVAGMDVLGVGSDHLILHSEWPMCANTGVMINSLFFYPGDALTIPPVQVQVLALPVSGPWLNIGQAIDYAIKVAPKLAFPIHDGMLKDDRLGSAHRMPDVILPKHGIELRALLSGETIEI